MIYNIRKIFTILTVMVMGGVLVYNCEPEPDSLGEQLFLDGAAKGDELAYDLTAYNIKNNDTINSSAFYLRNLIGNTSANSSVGVLGAFKEDQFGMQRASYYTQFRLPTYNPDFGTNAVVDSVVLVLKPVMADSLRGTTTIDDYVYPVGDVAAKKVVNTYGIKKFGKAKKKLTLQVQEVSEFMNGYTDKVYSNYKFATNSEILGTKEITDGNASSVVITKDGDESSLFSSSSPAVRIKLTDAANTIFQTKIINKKGQSELADVSNFIRHFKGLKISVAEEDGYLFQFYPNDMELIMYYKNDKDENGTNTRPQTKYSFVIGNTVAVQNTHSGYYEYDRTSADILTYANQSATGDQKLYTQGMGGNSIGIKFPDETINRLKKLYQDDKAAIISAKIRMYIDPTKWSNPYPKPAASDFTILKVVEETPEKPVYSFTDDYTSLGAAFIPVRSYMTSTPNYYEFTVTQSIKNIVEQNGDYKKTYLKIDLANFVMNSTPAIAGASYTTRPFSTLRTVFVGSDPTNADDDNIVTPNEIKLRVTFGTKK